MSVQRKLLSTSAWFVSLLVAFAIGVWITSELHQRALRQRAQAAAADAETPSDDDGASQDPSAEPDDSQLAEHDAEPPSKTAGKSVSSGKGIFRAALARRNAIRDRSRTRPPPGRELAAVVGSVEPAQPTVDPVTGSLEALAVDLRQSAGPIALLVERGLREKWTRPGLLGNAWQLSFEPVLLWNETAALVQHLGQITLFRRAADNIFRSADGQQLRFSADKIVLTGTDGTQKVFDPKGVLLRIDRPDGHNIVLEYDDQGWLDRVRGPFGSALDFAYAADGQLESIHDSDGRVVEYFRDPPPDAIAAVYRYDSAGRLAHIDDPLTGSMVFGRDPQGRVVSRTDRDGRQDRFEYFENRRRQIDAAGRIETIEFDAGRVIQTDPAGNQTIVTVDAATRTTTQQLPNGSQWIFEHDDRQRLKRTVDPLGNVTEHGYVADTDLPAFQILPDGTRREFHYDDRQRLTRIELGETAVLEIEYREDGLIAAIRQLGVPRRQFDYDPRGRLTEIRDERGTSRLEYDGRGNIIRVVDPLEHATRFEYDDHDRLLVRTDADDSQTRYQYDRLGRPIAQTDAAGNVSRITRADAGRIEQVTLPTGETIDFRYDRRGRLVEQRSSAGSVIGWEYDDRDNLTAVSAGEDSRWEFDHNPLGWTVRQTDPLGNQRKFEYDAAGNVTAVIDELGRQTRYAYDPLSRIIAVTDAAGHEQRFEYDADGRMVAHFDRLGRRIGVVYDRLGAPVNVKWQNTPLLALEESSRETITVSGPSGVQATLQLDPAGQVAQTSYSDGEKYQFRRDAAGRVIEASDALGNTWKADYSPVGNLVALTSPAESRYQYDYDPLGRLTAIQGPTGPIRKFAYDPLGRRIEVRDGLDRATRTSFGPDGMVARIELADGTHATLHRDRLGRILKVEPEKGSPTEWTYDAVGNVVAERLGDYRANFRYDDLDRLVEARYEPADKTITYTYDAGGRRTAMTIEKVGRWNYEYDDRDRLVTLADPGGKRTAFAYDQADRLVKKTLPNGMVVEQSYDPRGRPLTLAAKAADGTVLLERTDRYNQAGNLVDQTFHDGRQLRYEYDSQDQLVAVRDEIPRNRFRYDAVGNLLLADDSVTYDAGSQLVTYGDEGFTYDANGNMVQRTSAATKTQYTFETGRLTAVLHDGKPVARYGYDPAGRRISRTVGDQTSYFVYDGDDLLMESESDGSPLRIWTVGPQRYAPVAVQIGRRPYYPLTDVAGSTLLVCDADGKQVARWTYHPFGQPREQRAPNAPAISFTFAGCRYDPETKLYLAGLRYYDPLLGRFLSPDPLLGTLADPASMQSYQYARNNPFRYRDPTGAVAEDIANALSDTLGGLGQSAGYGLGYGVGQLLTAPARAYYWWNEDQEGINRINQRVETFANQVTAPSMGITTQIASSPVTEPLRLGSGAGTASVDAQQGNYGRAMLNMGADALRALPVASTLGSGAARTGLSNLANARRAERVYSAQGNVDNILKVRYRLPVQGKSPKGGTDGRIWGMTEGSVYAGRSSSNWANTRSARMGDTPFVFIEQAATIFKPHEVWGIFSLIKRLGGQHKGGFGDIRIIEWVRGGAGQVIVKRAELLSGQFAGQSVLTAASRLWGRRLIDLGMTLEALWLLDLLHESGQYEDDESLINALIERIGPDQAANMLLTLGEETGLLETTESGQPEGESAVPGAEGNEPESATAQPPAELVAAPNIPAEPMPPPKVTVPQLVGYPFAAAIEELTKVGLTGTPIRGNPAPDEKRDQQVYVQRPAGGESVDPGSAVELIFYGEPMTTEKVEVPNVVDLTQQQAEQTLVEAELVPNPKPGSEDVPDGARPGQVYAQDPAAGTELPKKDKVRFTYFEGIEVPNVVGQKRSVAIEKITEVRLTADPADGEKSPPSPMEVGNVYEQSPAPGTRLGIGDTVRILVYVRPGGFQPGDGARLHPELVNAEVRGLPGEPNTVLSFVTPGGSSNRTNHFQFTVAKLPSAAMAQKMLNESMYLIGELKEYATNTSLGTQGMKYSIYQIGDTRKMTASHTWNRTNGMPPDDWSQFRGGMIYRGQFLITLVVGRPFNHDFKNEAAIFDKCVKLIDERFPPE